MARIPTPSKRSKQDTKDIGFAGRGKLAGFSAAYLKAFEDWIHDRGDAPRERLDKAFDKLNDGRVSLADGRENQAGHDRNRQDN